MKQLIKLVLTLVCVISTSWSIASEQTADAVGYGNTRNLAISDALVQGLRQVTGVSVDSREVMQSISARSSSFAQSDEGESGVSSQTHVTAQEGQVALKTKGIISNYNILDVEQQEDGSFRADVQVTVTKYEKPGLPADSRRTLAVMPFHSEQKSFSLLGDRTAATKVEAEMRSALLDQFTQSRRVNVLDREFGAEYQDEKALWTGDDSALAEKARAGNVLGADYIVVGNIRSFNSRRHVETIQLTGERISSYSGSARVDYKIILAATRQVKWSDTLNYKFSDAQIRSMLSKYGSSQSGIANTVAIDIAQKALSNIYPMRVVAVKGSTIVLNQGGKTLKKGDMLSVYLLGDEMFDPYTKESLGQMEEKIATIKVVRVNAKTTYAKVVDGDAELIETGFIARR